MAPKKEKNHQPPVVDPDTHNDQLIAFFHKHKMLFLGSCVALMAIIAITFVTIKHYRDKKDNGWLELSRFISGQADPVELEEALSPSGDIVGSSAEPWGLFLLSVLEFKADNPKKALATLQECRSDFEDHYIFQSTMLGQTLLSKEEQEVQWRAEHPLKTIPSENQEPDSKPDQDTSE